MKITRNHIAIFLLGTGSLQMLGHATNQPVLRGIGLATGISPFPRVFCENGGYEAYAATYFLEWEDADGTKTSKKLTPEWYADIHGPYNRRNVYGAAIAFAPRMKPELRDGVHAFATARGSVLRRELGVPDDAIRLTIRIVPRDGENEGPWIYQMP